MSKKIKFVCIHLILCFAVFPVNAHAKRELHGKIYIVGEKDERHR